MDVLRESLEKELHDSGLEPMGSDVRVGPGLEIALFQGKGNELIVCQTAIGQRWPPYEERRRIRSRIRRARAARRLPVELRPTRSVAGTAPRRNGATNEKADVRPVLFTDAARSRHLLTWRQATASGFLRYIETRFDRTVMDQLLGGDRERDEAEKFPQLRSSRAAARRRPLLREVEMALASGLGDRSPPTSSRHLACWCRDLATPHLLEPLWKSLWRIRMIDPACTDASWLLAMGARLEELGLAVLDRIRCEVFAHVRHGGSVSSSRRTPSSGGPRPPSEGPVSAHSGGSLLTLVRTTDALADPWRTEVYVRRRVVTESLFGWCRRREHLRACRKELVHHLGVGDDGRDHGSNIRLCGRARTTVAPQARFGRSRNGVPDHPSVEDLHDESRVLHFTRSTALEGGGTAPEAERAERLRFWREWERRRRALVRAALESVTDDGLSPNEDLQLQGIGLWGRDDLCFVRGAG